MEPKGKAKVVMMSEDMQEPMPSLDKGENLSKEVNPEKETSVEDSSSYVGDTTPKEGEASLEIRSSYRCMYCKSKFSTSQALGGHQNTHRYAREQVKKQRVKGQPPRVLYPSYGHPNKLPLYNSNSFTLPLPGPPFGYTYSTLGFPATQYSQLTTGLTLGQPGQSCNMLDGRQFPVYNRSRMISPNIMNDVVNASYTSDNFNFGTSALGGDQFRILESFAAPNAFIDPYLPSVGYEGESSRGVVRNFFPINEGESNVRGNDGTIDLLSRVGMSIGEDDKSNAKGGNGDDES